MKDKVNIENLFKEKFESFSPKPDPSVFQGIQSGLNASGAAGGTAATGLSLTAKIAAIVVTSMTVGGSIGYFISDNNTTQILESNTTAPNEIVVDNTSPLVQTQNADNTSPTIKNPITIKEGKVYESKEVPEKRVQEYLGKQETKENTNDAVVKSEDHDESGEFTKIPKNDSKTVADNVNNNNASNNSDLVIPEYKDENKESNQSTNAVPKQVELSVLTNPRKGHAPLEVEFFAQSNAALFEWSFDDEVYSEAQNPIHTFDTPGKYNVTVTAFIVNYIDGEKIITEETQDVVIEVQPKSRITKIPNIFTPNGDGQNDWFYVETESISNFTITFVDTRGKVLYKSNDPDFKWDGRDFYGNPVNGTIFYNIEAIGEDGSIIQERRQLQIER